MRNTYSAVSTRRRQQRVVVARPAYGGPPARPARPPQSMLPRLRACRAARSSAAATRASGPVDPRAACRACSSGSAHDRRELTMQLPAFAGREVGVRDRGEQGMREPQPRAVELDDTGVEHLGERPTASRGFPGGGGHRVDVGLCHGGGEQQQPTCGRAQTRQPVGHQRAQVGRNGQGLVGIRLAAVAAAVPAPSPD